MLHTAQVGTQTLNNIKQKKINLNTNNFVLNKIRFFFCMLKLWTSAGIRFDFLKWFRARCLALVYLFHPHPTLIQITPNETIYSYSITIHPPDFRYKIQTMSSQVLLHIRKCAILWHCYNSSVNAIGSHFPQTTHNRTNTHRHTRESAGTRLNIFSYYGEMVS